MVPTTKRRTLAQVLVCNGCCCGRVEKGRPAIPLDWLKAEWKGRRLHRHVHLTVSGCLGPCDLANVVLIITPLEQIWLGGIQDAAPYELLLEWADDSGRLGALLPLPAPLDPYRFERYQPLERSDDLCASASL